MKLIATLLTLLALAAPVRAHHIEQQPFDKEGVEGLLQTAREVGVKVRTERSGPQFAKHCKRDGILGGATRNGYLLICVDNHGEDVDELADTIRHEVLHLAQFCRGGLLQPGMKEPNLEFAVNGLHMPTGNYDKKDYYKEAEARVGAHYLSEQGVADTLLRACRR